MSKSVIGYVLRVKQFANGDMNIIFVTVDDEELELHYIADTSERCGFTKEMAQTLARTLDSDIWAEIHYDDTDTITSIELEVATEEDFEEE